MKRVTVIAGLLCGYGFAADQAFAAAEVAEQTQDITTSPPPFINRYHPDWPRRGYGFDVQELEQIPYYRTPLRTPRPSKEFRPWFYRRSQFSRYERWPYKR